MNKNYEKIIGKRQHLLCSLRKWVPQTAFKNTCCEGRADSPTPCPFGSSTALIQTGPHFPSCSSQCLSTARTLVPAFLHMTQISDFSLGTSHCPGRDFPRLRLKAEGWGFSYPILSSPSIFTGGHLLPGLMILDLLQLPPPFFPTQNSPSKCLTLLNSSWKLLRGPELTHLLSHRQELPTLNI